MPEATAVQPGQSATAERAATAVKEQTAATVARPDRSWASEGPAATVAQALSASKAATEGPAATVVTRS
ncbi:hypothetical protein RA985_20485, partial [Mycobacteroides abscessus subsp. abscessus]